MDKLKFVIMGYGHIARVHEEALNSAENAELVAVVDPEKAGCYLPRFNDLYDFQASGISADAVIIATPNGLHFEHAKNALVAGFHVIVEKPVTLNSQDLERLIYISEQNDRRLFNMLQLRFSPVVEWVHNILKNKLLGKIYLVNIQCYWNRNETYYSKRPWHGTRKMDGGVLFTQFSHFVDVMHYWFEELKPKDIRNFNFNHQNSTEFADSGIINFEIPEGGFGTMTYTTSTYEKNFDSTITIIAEKGTLQIGGQYMNKINYLNAEDLELPFEEIQPTSFHLNALEEISNAIRSGKPSKLDAVNARNVIKFLEVVS